jgi:hypothetical protein
VRRPAVVPRLSLPLSAGGSTPIGTAGRRLLGHAAEQRGSARGSGAGGSDRTGEGNVLALQRLGYACGQSAMCGDLAAFVAHKQMCGPGEPAARGDAAAAVAAPRAADGPHARGPCGAGAGNLGSDGEEGGEEDEEDSWASDVGPLDGAAGPVAGQMPCARRGAASPEPRQALPEALRVKLLLLACLERTAECYAAARCPPPVAPVHLLVSELLVPAEEMWALSLGAGKARGSRDGGGAAANASPVAAGVAELRRRAIQVVAAFGRLLNGSSGGGGGGDDTQLLDARPKAQDDAVSALRARLARLVGQDRDTMRGAMAGRHVGCRIWPTLRRT